MTLTEDTSTNAFGSFTQRENPGLTRIGVVESSNPSLLPTNGITFLGGLSGVSGSFELIVNPVPNQNGVAVLTFLTTNNVGDRATNFLSVNVTPVLDPTSATWARTGFDFSTTTNVVTVTNTLRLSDPDTLLSGLTVRILCDNALLVPPGSISVLPGESNRTVLVSVNAALAGQASLFAEITDPADGTVARTSTFEIRVSAGNGGQPLRHVTTIPDTDFAVFGLGGLRGVGHGTMSVTGLVGAVQQATLYWHGPGQRDPGFFGILPTIPMFGISILDNTAVGVRASGANCWSQFAFSVTERGDVTHLVPGNTNLVLTSFLREACSDGFPQVSCAVQDINGASLLVFYDDGNPANNRDVMVFEGNDASESNPFDAPGWSNRLAGVRYTGGLVGLGLHVGDGQTTTDGTRETLNKAGVSNCSLY